MEELEAAYNACLTQTTDPLTCQVSRRTDADPTPGAPSTPAITVTDLVTLSPDAATVTADPFNVGVAHRPTNFVAPATTHTREGTVLGLPLTARFTPVAYDFTYGDGTIATTTTGGSTWEDLGVPQFTPTPTSHVYTERGTYTATVSIRYTAEINLGTGWTTLPGELTIPGPTQDIRIYEAHTALVAHTCTEDPDAVGC